jgi:hypothetical protein
LLLSCFRDSSASSLNAGLKKGNERNSLTNRQQQLAVENALIDMKEPVGDERLKQPRNLNGSLLL